MHETSLPAALGAGDFNVVLQAWHAARVYVDLGAMSHKTGMRVFELSSGFDAKINGRRSRKYLPADAQDVLQEHVAQLAAQLHQQAHTHTLLNTRCYTQPHATPARMLEGDMQYQQRQSIWARLRGCIGREMNQNQHSK